MPLQDISKPACEEYKTQARQKRQKRIDEAKPLPHTSYFSYLVINIPTAFWFQGFKNRYSYPLEIFFHNKK